MPPAFEDDDDSGPLDRREFDRKWRRSFEQRMDERLAALSSRLAAVESAQRGYHEEHIKDEARRDGSRQAWAGLGKIVALLTGLGALGFMLVQIIQGIANAG